MAGKLPGQTGMDEVEESVEEDMSEGSESEDGSNDESTDAETGDDNEDGSESGTDGECSGEDDDGEDDEGDNEEGEEDEEEDDEDTEEYDDNDEEKPSHSHSVTAMDVSSESDGESTKCPICLARIADQDIGTPESCDHDFCLECILEWAKNVNTCPVDRQVFNLVFAKHCAEGTVYKRIPIQDNNAQAEDADDLTYCEVCGQANREDRLLLCDGCDLGYHCECLEPSLDSVPVGMWFCPDCVRERGDDEEIVHGRRRRQIGRTLISERVRAIITNARAERGRVRSRRRISSDESEEEFLELAVVPKPKPKTPRKKRKTTRKKRKTTRKKRKTKKRKTTTKTSTKKPKRKTKRKGKRKSKKSRARTKSITPRTTKMRLADRLGMKKPPAGRSIPTVKESVAKGMDVLKHDIGISSLSILGSRDDLDPFIESDDERSGYSGGGLAVARAPVPRIPRITKASMLSHRTIPPPRRRSSVKIEQPPSQSNGFDLLGDILQSQKNLNMNLGKVTIHRDGSLKTDNGPKKSDQNGLVKNSSISHSEPQDCEGEKKPDGNSGGSPTESPPQQQQQQQQQQETTTFSQGNQQEASSGSLSDNSADGDMCIDTGATGDDDGAESPPLPQSSLDDEEEQKKCAALDNNSAEDKVEKSTSDAMGDNTAISSSNNQLKGSDEQTAETMSSSALTSYDPVESMEDNSEQKDKEAAESMKSDAAATDDNKMVDNEPELYNPEEATQPNESSQDSTQDKNDNAEISHGPIGVPFPSFSPTDPSNYTTEDITPVNIAPDNTTSDMEDIIDDAFAANNPVNNMEESVANDDSQDCPTPVFDENGPASPDPEDQNGPGDLSEDVTPYGSPLTQNDITPVLSPVGDDNIPISKHGNSADSPSAIRDHHGSPRSDRDSDCEERERGLTESEDEEYNKRFMPVSELPRIPKKRSKKTAPPEVIVIEDEDSPPPQHRSSVLERVNVRDSDGYKWDGRSRRRRNDSDGSDHHRHRHHHAADSDDDRHNRDRAKKRHRSRRSRSRERERSRERRRRSRSRSRRKLSRRSLSRSRDRRRSRSRERRRHRSRTPKKREKHRDRTKKRDRRSRSSSRDRFGRSDPSEFKASIKTFSQTLKEVSSSDSRKFKLKRNFYNEVIDGSSSKDRDNVREKPSKAKHARKEEKGGWRSVSLSPPPQQSERKIETVISSARRWSDQSDEPPARFEDSDDSLLEEEPSESAKSPPQISQIKPQPSNNISVSLASETAPKPRSPPPLHNYDPSEPTDDFSRPPMPAAPLVTSDGPLIPGLGGLASQSSPIEQGMLLRPSLEQRMHGDGSLGMLRPQPSTMDMMREQAMVSQQDVGNAMRPSMVIRTPLGLVRTPSMVVNPLLGPPPPFNQFSPQLRMSDSQPNFMQLPPGQRLRFTQNGLPLQDNCAGPPPMLGDGLPQLRPPMMPDMRHPPPPSHQQLPGSGPMPDNLTTPPPPLPAKALEQMQQISNLLNAQVRLAQLAPGKQPPSEQEQHQQQQQPHPSLLGPPPAGLARLESRVNRGKSDSVFKVPLPPPPLLTGGKLDNGRQLGDKKTEETTEVVDMDVASPYSDDEVGINISFNPPLKKRVRGGGDSGSSGGGRSNSDDKNKRNSIQQKLDAIFGKADTNKDKSQQQQQQHHQQQNHSKKKREKLSAVKFNLGKPGKVPSKPSVDKSSDDVPTSAVELDKQQKVKGQRYCYLKKLNRQERVVEEVKLAIKPHYANGKISKEDYKEILRKTVPKICHSKSGDINPEKIRNYVEAYVTKVRQLKKYHARKDGEPVVAVKHGSKKVK